MIGCAWGTVFLLLQSHQFERFEHADGARAGFVVGTNKAEGPLVSEQRLSIALVGDDNRLIAESSVHLSKRKDNLVSVAGLRENIAGESLAPQFLAQRNSGAFQDLPQGHTLIVHLRPI